MNELELLSRYRHSEPVDEAVIASAVDALLAAPDRHTRTVQRRTGARIRRAAWASVSLVAAAGAAVAGVALDASPTNHHAATAPPPSGLHGASLAAYVTDQTVAALDAATGYVQHTIQHDPRGTTLSWRGPNAVLDENPGRVASLITWAADGSSTILYVDYQHRTWYRDTMPTPPTSLSSPPAPVKSSPFDPVNNGEPTAASIAAWFHQPGTKLLGTTTIDGVSTYQLQMPPPLDPNGKPMPSIKVTAWVDATTYMPVRIVTQRPAAEGTDNGTRVAIPATTITDDFNWQPATPAALAVFDLTPPAGFERAPDPALQPIPAGH